MHAYVSVYLEFDTCSSRIYLHAYYNMHTCMYIHLELNTFASYACTYITVCTFSRNPILAYYMYAHKYVTCMLVCMCLIFARVARYWQAHFICICVCTYVRMHIYVSIHQEFDTCESSHLLASVLYIYMCVCVCVFTFSHTHIHLFICLEFNTCESSQLLASTRADISH
jgi:hypothetical protein